MTIIILLMNVSVIMIIVAIIVTGTYIVEISCSAVKTFMVVLVQVHPTMLN